MNDSDKAICQNRQFYFNKLNEFIASKVEEIRKTEPEILLVTQSKNYPEGFPIDEEEIYPKWSWEKTTKKKGGQKALVVNGPLAGKTIYVEISETYKNQQNNEENPAAEQTPKKVSTLAERKERKHRQRQRHAIDALMNYIKACEYETPDRDTIFKLIAALGVNSIFHMNWNNENEDEKGVWEGIAAYEKASELDDLDKRVWGKLTEKILHNLKKGQSGPIDASWTESEIISPVVCFDLEKAFEVAVEALPDPKAWEKLEAVV